MASNDINQTNNDEARILIRLVVDAEMIRNILDDWEYAPDQKRKLIYERINHIREGANRWINIIENDSEIDQNYVFGVDNPPSY